jgi:hypothetical protein
MTLALIQHEEGCVPFNRCRACAAVDIIATSGSKELLSIFQPSDGSLFDPSAHLPTCTPVNPCRNCESVALLKSSLGETKFQRLMALLDDSKSLEQSRLESNPDWLRMKDYLLRDIAELELTSRSANCLKGENINFVGQICTKTENELLRIPAFGRKSLNEVKEVLRSMGLRLNMDFPVDVTYPN